MAQQWPELFCDLLDFQYSKPLILSYTSIGLNQANLLNFLFLQPKSPALQYLRTFNSNT